MIAALQVRVIAPEPSALWPSAPRNISKILLLMDRLAERIAFDGSEPLRLECRTSADCVTNGAPVILQKE